MKKLLMITAITLISLTATAQRAEDACTKICYYGYVYGNTYMVYIWNKTNVATGYTITWPDGRTTVLPYIVSPGGSANADYLMPHFIPGPISVKPTRAGGVPVTISVVSTIANKRCL